MRSQSLLAHLLTILLVQITQHVSLSVSHSQDRCYSFTLLSTGGLPQISLKMTTFHQFLPARRYASAGNSDHNVSVRLSVCLSITRRYCVKTKKASIMISSPSGSPKTLVFSRQISSPNSKGFPRTGPQTRVGRKNSAIF